VIDRAEIDCLIIGHNDADFDALMRRVREGAEVSGRYADLKLNSVLVGGRRMHHMDLLNHTLGTDYDVFSQPHLGAHYLASFLRRRGLRTEVVNRFRRERARLDALLDAGARTVAITTTYYIESEPLAEIVEHVRRRAPETTIVVGGPFVFNTCSYYDAADQDYVFATVGADVYVFDSQGESTLAAAVTALRDGGQGALGGVPNLIYRDGGAMARSPRAVERNDLDQNPIDWSAFDRAALGSTVYLRTARSCPFACSFCNYPTLAGEHVVAGIEAVVAELRRLAALDVHDVVFVDDTFNVPLPRFKALLRRIIEERLDLRWMSFFRCSNADDDAFDLMQRAGCVGVFLGIESGDEQILKAMNKFAQVDRYASGIRALESRGIFTYASVIVGFPGETRASVERSIELLERARPSFFYPQIYFHDVTAPIHARRKELGIRGAGLSWSHPSMDWREAVGWARAMYERVTASELMPGYSLSCWGAFYLMSRGVTLAELREFMRRTRPMVLAGFDEREAEGVAELATIFTRHGQLPVAAARARS
jgi:p-methyltransferase